MKALDLLTFCTLYNAAKQLSPRTRTRFVGKYLANFPPRAQAHNQTLGGGSLGPQEEAVICMFYNPDFIIYSSLGSFYIPCLVMIVLYTRIFRVGI